MIITSNRTREIHDALKRRCFYHWVDYPAAEREMEIIRVRLPGAPERLSRQIVGFVQRCARRTCSSCRASPRRSTGPRR